MYKTIILLIVSVLAITACRTNKSDGYFIDMRIAPVVVDGKIILPTISIDGKYYDIDTSGDTLIFLSNGKHEIKVEAKGFKAHPQIVQALDTKESQLIKVVLEKNI